MPESLPITWESIKETDYIGKEHFFDFQSLRAEEFTKTLAGRAFNTCVGGLDPRYTTEQTSWGGRRISGFSRLQPLEGLIIAKRVDAGLDPYLLAKLNEYPSLSVVSQEYAILAGSMPNIVPRLDNERSKTDKFLLAITAQLLTSFMDN